jgi:uncharacterized protein YbaP (TraB family)
MKSIKFFFWLTALVASGASVQAQRSSSSLLWQVSGKGLATPSYLFGTFHLMCKSDFSAEGVLKEKLAASKQFYGEVAMDDPTIAMQLAGKMVSANSLESMVTPEEFKRLGTNFQNITGLPLAMFNNFKPFMALSLVTLSTISCTDRIQPETELVNIAKEHQLPILGLETVDDQINAINKEPLDSQLNDLKRILNNFDSVKTVMADLTAVYKKRNVDSLYAFMKAAGTDGQFEQNLLIERNQRWIPVMEKAMNDKASFFAVGAGHLGGPEGVLELLRKRGYRVTPVMY